MSVEAPDWLVDFLGGISLWDAILIIAALVVVILFIKNKGWKTVVALARGIINAAQILEAVQGLPAYIARADERNARLEEKVDGIHHETHKNDGSSIKDAVARVEEGVAGLHGRMDDVDRQLVTLTREDESLWEALEHTQNPEEGS